MNRIKERKTAFEIIFTVPFNKEKNIDELITNYCSHEEDIEITDYVQSTVCGVLNNLEAIDELIKKNIKNRKFERLDNVCLAVMRLGVYEMLFNDDIPVSVAINEAIELIKNYDDSLSGFVHGNLAIIANSNNE